MTRNELFYKVLLGGFIVVMFLGAGVIFVIIEDASQTIILRLIGAFTGLITAIVGFATGYLLGQRNGNGHNGQ